MAFSVSQLAREKGGREPSTDWSRAGCGRELILANNEISARSVNGRRERDQMKWRRWDKLWNERVSSLDLHAAY